MAKGTAQRKSQFGLLILIIIGVLLTSLLAVLTASENGSPLDNLIPKQILLIRDLGLVGASDSSSSAGAFRHAYLGSFSISSVQEDSRIAFSEGAEVARGLITSQEHEIPFPYSEESLKVSFKVSRTNSYGSLVARVNGKVVWSGTPGSGSNVEFQIPKGAASLANNSLLFMTTSSGWKIWSPAHYSLSQIAISRERASKASEEFSFQLLDSEVDSFLLGRITYTVEQVFPDGAVLLVKLNNATIWKGPSHASTLPFSVDFSDAITKVSGRNAVAFEIEDGARISVVNSEAIIFTSGAASGTPTATFNLERQDIDNLRAKKTKGSIEFTVSDVSRSGEYQVSLIGDRESVLLSAEAKEGKVKVSFQDGQAVFGKNTLVFGSRGEAAFRVKDLSVRLEKT